MPNESAQPFADQTKRDPRDEQLVGEILGEKVAEEMQELVDGSEQPSEKAPELRLSENEQVAAEENEQEVTPKQRRQEYIEWVEEHLNKDVDWVDKTFIFETDGRVRVEGDLRLNNIGISELPPGLYSVDGMLNLANNRMTTIKIPDSVTMLYLFNNRITQIRDIPDSIAILELENNPIESLNFLVGKTLKELNIGCIKAKTIPRGIHVEKVSINSLQTELIADARAKGYHITII